MPSRRPGERENVDLTKADFVAPARIDAAGEVERVSELDQHVERAVATGSMHSNANCTTWSTNHRFYIRGNKFVSGRPVR